MGEGSGGMCGCVCGGGGGGVVFVGVCWWVWGWARVWLSVGGWVGGVYVYVYGVHPVFLAEILPYTRPYTVSVHGSGQLYVLATTMVMDDLVWGKLL